MAKRSPRASLGLTMGASPYAGGFGLEIFSKPPPPASQVHEEHLSGIFSAREDRTFAVNLRRTFRPRYFELDECEEKAFAMTSLAIDEVEQLIMPDPLPMDVLRNRAPLMLPAGVTLSITVRNLTRRTLRLRMRLVGDI